MATRVAAVAALLGGLVAGAVGLAAPVAAQTGCYSWTPVPAVSSIWTDGAYRYWTLEAGGELFVFEDPAVPQELATGNGLNIDLVTKCATLPDPTPTPTATPTVAPTATPIPAATPTMEPTATPTVAPTATPTTAPTATPDPTATPATPDPTTTPVPDSTDDDTPGPDEDTDDRVLGLSPDSPTSTPGDDKDEVQTFGADTDPESPDTEVAGAGAAQDDEDEAAGALALTGADSRRPALLALGLIAFGAALVGLSIRRTAA